MTSLFLFLSCFALCQELCIHLSCPCGSRNDEVTQHRGTSASQGSVCVERESTSSFPPWALGHEEQCPYVFPMVDVETPPPCEAAVL